jgi:hypothetical protein
MPLSAIALPAVRRSYPLGATISERTSKRLTGASPQENHRRNRPQNSFHEPFLRVRLRVSILPNVGQLHAILGQVRAGGSQATVLAASSR